MKVENSMRRYSFKLRKEKRVKYLSDVKRRLEEDVGSYFTCAEEVRRTSKRGIGLWALIRMLFPIIESVSQVTSKGSKKFNIQSGKQVRLLRKLGFEYPNLIWQMYRHALIHNDKLMSLRYHGRQIDWSLSIGDSRQYESGVINLDLKQLYNDLVAYLDHEIAQSKQKSVWVRDVCVLTSQAKRELREEFDRFSRRQASVTI